MEMCVVVASRRKGAGAFDGGAGSRRRTFPRGHVKPGKVRKGIRDLAMLCDGGEVCSGRLNLAGSTFAISIDAVGQCRARQVA